MVRCQERSGYAGGYHGTAPRCNGIFRKEEERRLFTCRTSHGEDGRCIHIQLSKLAVTSSQQGSSVCGTVIKVMHDEWTESGDANEGKMWRENADIILSCPSFDRPVRPVAVN